MQCYSRLKRLYLIDLVHHEHDGVNCDPITIISGTCRVLRLRQNSIVVITKLLQQVPQK